MTQANANIDYCGIRNLLRLLLDHGFTEKELDPDIFISQSNELDRRLRAAKQEKERLLADEDDDTIPRTRELMEALETLPEFLPVFDGEIFTDLVERVTAEEDGTLQFRLRNGLELTETTDLRQFPGRSKSAHDQRGSGAEGHRHSQRRFGMVHRLHPRHPSR